MNAVDEAFEAHARTFEASRALRPQVCELARLAVRSLQAGGKLLVFGNGGSAADAQHFAAELVGRFARERRPLPALALGVDSALTTALGNDYGYESVFARPVEAFARADDLVLAISTSGKSRNVIAAVKAARAIGCAAAGLTGSGGSMLAALVDVAIIVPSTDVARIQEIHELCLHALAAAIESQLFEEGKP
jgi:D-sedoheptulose 7-phosphate isomerase